MREYIQSTRADMKVDTGMHGHCVGLYKWILYNRHTSLHVHISHMEEILELTVHLEKSQGSAHQAATQAPPRV